MRENFKDALSGNNIKKPTIFRLIKKRPNPALKGRHYPSIKRLPSTEEIYDSKKDITRTIRYAQGESSIYKEDQPQKVVLSDIIFQNGHLAVDFTNPTLLKFLSASNLNAENPDRKKEKNAVFVKLDPNKDAGISIEKEISQARAVSTVAGLEFDDLKAYGRVLGVNINRGGSEIRHDMVLMAKSDPETFMNGLDNPVTKRQQVMYNAIEAGIVSISNRGAHWIMGDTRKLIVPIPPGMDVMVWFSEWTMNEKDGGEVFKEIEKRLKKRNE